MDLDIISTGDLAIENGDLKTVSKVDEVRQQVLIRLRTQFNEWVFNNTMGIDYFRNIMIKNPNFHLIKLEITNEILKVDKVSKVKFIDIYEEERRLKVDFVFLVRDDSEKSIEIDDHIYIDFYANYINIQRL